MRNTLLNFGTPLNHTEEQTVKVVFLDKSDELGTIMITQENADELLNVSDEDFEDVCIDILHELYIQQDWDTEYVHNHFTSEIRMWVPVKVEGNTSHWKMKRIFRPLDEYSFTYATQHSPNPLWLVHYNKITGETTIKAIADVEYNDETEECFIVFEDSSVVPQSVYENRTDYGLCTLYAI